MPCMAAQRYAHHCPQTSRKEADMTTIVPQFPIKIYQRQDETYCSSMVAFIIVDETDHWQSIFVTISGTPVPMSRIAFSKVLINGEWLSHD